MRLRRAASGHGSGPSGSETIVSGDEGGVAGSRHLRTVRGEEGREEQFEAIPDEVESDELGWIAGFTGCDARRGGAGLGDGDEGCGEAGVEAERGVGRGRGVGRAGDDAGDVGSAGDGSVDLLC